MPLALLSFESFLSAASSNGWAFLGLLVFGSVGLQYLTAPFTARIKAGERERLRKMYERLALEKLEVIKTALTMGYKQNDLAELDARLESVIGSDAMQKLLTAKNISGMSKGSGTVIGINIESGSKSKQAATTIDLDDLVNSELTDGLRERARQRDRE